MKEELTWSNKKRFVGELIGWERNPRYGTKEDARRLLESWKEMGQVHTIACGPNGELYDGHLRVGALVAAYGEDYEVDVRESNRPLTEEEREKLVIYLHASGQGKFNWDELAGWDIGKLKEWGLFDVKDSWVDGVRAIATLERLEEESAVAGADDIEWGEISDIELSIGSIGVGDVVYFGDHVLICGNALSDGVWDSVAGFVDGIDMFWGDVPTEKDFVKIDGSVGVRLGELRGLVSAVIGKASELMDSGAPAYLSHAGGLRTIQYALAFSDIWHYHQELVWVKSKFTLSRTDYQYGHELLIYGWKEVEKGIRHRWYGDNARSTVIKAGVDFSKMRISSEKPVELIQECISNSSKRGDVICDPFAGSGSTLIACELLGRRFVGIEVKPENVVSAIERYKAMFPSAKILKNGEPIMSEWEVD